MIRFSAPPPPAVTDGLPFADVPADLAEGMRANPVRSRRSWFHPTTLLAVALCASLSLAAWSKIEQPVPVPDFHGTVAGLAFSPFQRGQSGETNNWPTDDQIHDDLKRVARVTNRIRTYSVQGTLGDIPELASHLPLKVTLGAWIDDNASNNQAELSKLIEVAHTHRNVDRVLVGNEVILRGNLSTTELIADIEEARRALHVPVSTAEPWHIWLAHPDLARSVDYITIHLLPYWEGLPVEDALRYTMEKLAQVQAAYPDKHIVIGEVGWPSNGVDIGGARADRVNQALFMRKFFIEAQRRHLDYFVMEAFDQPWKTSFEGRAAGYWGMMDLDRQAKWSMTGPVTETPNWPSWAGISIALAALVSVALLSRRPDIRLPGKLVLAGLTQIFAATLACVLLAMAGKYLSGLAMLVWGGLALGQALLLLLLLADSFELAETVWGRVWKRRPAVIAPPLGTILPKVSIHIPICNEPPHMVRQTLDALAELDYPDFEVLVIDNNTMNPALWEPVAEHCARLGERFRFFHLGRYPGFKAGALNFALRETAPDAEVVGVLDSDYVVSPDWLRCMVPHFANPKVGFVQSPQDYRDNDGSFFKRLMFWEYAGFFQLGMVTRNERNAIIQHGTMTLIRRHALDNNGGWAEWTITEDAELGLRLFRAGWEAVYSNQSFGRGVMPDDFAAFRKQRFRWAYGAMQICRRHSGALLSPFNRELTLGQKWHFVTGWLPWVGDALGLLFLMMGLVWSIGLIAAPHRFEFPIVLFMAPSIGLFAFKLVQIFTLYRSRVKCGWQDRVGAAIAGLALSHTIGKAVWKGLIIKSAPFLRTPKMEDAPALIQGLVMAREELALLILTWAAMIGVGVTHHLATPEAQLWCLVLLTQSLPYAASVLTSVVAARPMPRRLPVTARPKRPSMVASGIAGDIAGD
jgi:exo-beta-1,3-glucanase (GH17 family)/cellulose synthase/poly-beta-1,6-N-acetylglucosamine synthase-like glycosyltransferase